MQETLTFSPVLMQKRGLSFVYYKTFVAINFKLSCSFLFPTQLFREENQFLHHKLKDRNILVIHNLLFKKRSCVPTKVKLLKQKQKTYILPNKLNFFFVKANQIGGQVK